VRTIVRRRPICLRRSHLFMASSAFRTPGDHYVLRRSKFLICFIQIQFSAGVQIATSSSTANDRPETGSTNATICVSKFRPQGAWGPKSAKKLEKIDSWVEKHRRKNIREQNAESKTNLSRYNPVMIGVQTAEIQSPPNHANRHFWTSKLLTCRRTVTLPPQ